MVDIGAQDGPELGVHHKNVVKYQKDIDAFVHVIRGALQPISVPPSETHISTLGTIAWVPPPGEQHITQSYHNPNQKPEENLGASAVTRAVGGMATHWTCACPRPHLEEHKLAPVSDSELGELLDRATDLIGVRTEEFECSKRHTVLRKILRERFGEDRIKNLPLGVKRINKHFVTWSAVDTILGRFHKTDRFRLEPETMLTKVIWRNPVFAQDDPNYPGPYEIVGALLKSQIDGKTVCVKAQHYVIACGAVGTPQILYNSKIRPWALGRFLAEQSLAFCQVVLKRSIVRRMAEEYPDECKRHASKHPGDKLPIPWGDPEPQLTMPYSWSDNPEESDKREPWHVQIHRDAFSYGDVGPRADPRVVVDLRFFGKQDICPDNRVSFPSDEMREIIVEPDKDAYGMPQATFHVKRSEQDGIRDHEMMLEMCEVAGELGAFLPGSQPQFVEPGLALHITGTTRLGRISGEEKDQKRDEATKLITVADQNSKVHDFRNLYVGGNGCIPDSTACNPTLTSVAYAIKSARYIVKQLEKRGSQRVGEGYEEVWGLLTMNLPESSKTNN
ncbi:hypothetical protein FRC08_005431 [Ceratobasidium sp. 394]|nr:hypothetical protein FRC08_005431 [Ceratobasidium sp. 394]